jgi:hypothetical protein
VPESNPEPECPDATGGEGAKETRFGLLNSIPNSEKL